MIGGNLRPGKARFRVRLREQGNDKTQDRREEEYDDDQAHHLQHDQLRILHADIRADERHITRAGGRRSKHAFRTGEASSLIQEEPDAKARKRVCAHNDQHRHAGR